MSYRVVALDLDGTLLDGSLQIREESIRALNACREQGVMVMIVTGRHHVAAYPYYDQLGLELPAICCNGTYAYDFHKKQALFSRPLSWQQAHFVLNRMRHHDVHGMVYINDAMTYEVSNNHLDSLLTWSKSLSERVRPKIVKVDSYEDVLDTAPIIWKFAVSHSETDRIEAFVADLEACAEFSCERSAHNRYDVALTGNSKGGLLKSWLESVEIAPDQAMAFGDNYNDISMLQMVGLGVAMGESDEYVKACADVVIGSHNSNAIAEALHYFVLE